MPTEPPHEVDPRLWLDYRRKRFWAVALVLAYVLAGAVVAPPIVRRQIVASAQQALDRPAALDGVRINPLFLSVDLRGFRLSEKDGSPLLGFDRFYVRRSLDSLLHRAWSFGQIRLEGFTGDVIRYGPTDTNIGRLIQAAAPAADGAKPATEAAAPRLIIRHLGIQDAKLAFTDRVPETPFTTEIGPVTAEIDRFSTLPDKTGQQHVVIDLEGGAILEWASDFSLSPLASKGHVKASGPYAPLLSRYLGDALLL